MFISNGDMILSAMFAAGLLQFFWLSVVLTRKGINPSLIRLSMVPLLAIWVLVWPAYDHTIMPLLSLTLFLFPLLLATRSQSPFARHLRLCWHTSPEQIRQPTPWLMLLLSLLISAVLFYDAPELGLGVALSFCLAWSAAEWIDKTGKGIQLGLARNPLQTLVGHLMLVFASSLICAWALQLYHGITWQQFYVATLIASLAASSIRALIRAGWNMPFAILGMSLMLWIL